MRIHLKRIYFIGCTVWRVDMLGGYPSYLLIIDENAPQMPILKNI